MAQALAVDDPDDLRCAQCIVALGVREGEAVLVAQVGPEGQDRVTEVRAHARLARTEPTP